MPGTTPPALGPFFALAARAPRLTAALGPLAVPLIPLVAPGIRANTRLNARRIFGRVLPPAQQRAFTRHVVANFYAFITDVARAAGQTPDSNPDDGLVGNVFGQAKAVIRDDDRIVRNLG